ncbi:zinc finger domain-containing protein [Streptomyces sp. CY1]|uniref:zinc finger domain-containing protein n=1 Tax=Streptomyces sp. CY1 TaxID=3388313 RepID=UPI003C12C5B5
MASCEVMAGEPRRGPSIWGPAGILAKGAAVLSDADEVERHPCPRCLAGPGSPCRSRSGAVAGTYHTGRFAKVARLAKELRVPTPADRGPGQPWRPGTPSSAPIAPDAPSADIRIGYALLTPQPGTPVPARRPRSARHRPRQDLLREDLHPHPGPAPVRGPRSRRLGRSRPTPRTAGSSSPSTR